MTSRPVRHGQRITARSGVYLRVIDAATTGERIGDRDQFRIVVDESCSHLSPDTDHGDLLPPAGSPVLMVHGPAPLDAAVVEIAQAWNWAAKSLASRSLTSLAHRTTYHLEHRPLGSRLTVRAGQAPLTDSVEIGRATDIPAFSRAAWRCAIQLVDRQMQRHDIKWRAAPAIYSKAFAEPSLR